MAKFANNGYLLTSGTITSDVGGRMMFHCSIINITRLKNFQLNLSPDSTSQFNNSRERLNDHKSKDTKLKCLRV